MNRESIDSLARRLAASLPQGLRAVRDDIEANFRAVLQSSLARMDLVTRDEFEVQEMVLARAREKLEGLEQRLSACEEAERARDAAATQPDAGKTRKKTAGKKTTKTTGKTAKKTTGKSTQKAAGRAAGKLKKTPGRKKTP